MIDLNNIPGAWYGEEHNDPWLRNSRGHRPAGPSPLWNEHYDSLLAEAEARRSASRLQQGQKWQCRLCIGIGQWLIRAGRWLENAGGQPIAAPAQ
jgi:hypothetical protein